MNKQITLKKQIQELLAENIIYLNYIGVFKENKEEVFSVADSNYDSTFDLNFVHAFTSISAIRNKNNEKEDLLGCMRSFFINYKEASYYCEQVESNYLLIVFKKGFENLGFMVHLISKLKEGLIQANS